eukprot:COSAG01_NODE_11241_length_1974_cov_5.101867_1_plen_90_part_00
MEVGQVGQRSVCRHGTGEYVKRPTLMFGDNCNARDWAIEEMTTYSNRMIDRKYRIVRERVKMGEILPVWIDGKTNLSDVDIKVPGVLAR